MFGGVKIMYASPQVHLFFHNIRPQSSVTLSNCIDVPKASSHPPTTLEGNQ